MKHLYLSKTSTAPLPNFSCKRYLPLPNQVKHFHFSQDFLEEPTLDFWAKISRPSDLPHIILPVIRHSQTQDLASLNKTYTINITPPPKYREVKKMDSKVILLMNSPCPLIWTLNLISYTDYLVHKISSAIIHYRCYSTIYFSHYGPLKTQWSHLNLSNKKILH